MVSILQRLGQLRDDRIRVLAQVAERVSSPTANARTAVIDQPHVLAMAHRSTRTSQFTH